jgi:hypothetical protein
MPRKSESYPYPIAEVICPPDHVLNKIDPWICLEFFRIEALLRSPTVHQLYRNAQRGGMTTQLDAKEHNFFLFDLYGITWEICPPE